jgi:hypothetical protein
LPRDTEVIIINPGMNNRLHKRHEVVGEEEPVFIQKDDTEYSSLETQENTDNPNDYINEVRENEEEKREENTQPETTNSAALDMEQEEDDTTMLIEKKLQLLNEREERLREEKERLERQSAELLEKVKSIE